MTIKTAYTPEQLVEMAEHNLHTWWTEGDLDAASADYLDSYVLHFPDGDLDLAGFRGFVETYREAFPDMEMHVEDCFATEDRVCLRWRSTGTHDGDLPGIEATGNSVEVTGVTVHRIEDGKFAETWGQYDALGLRQQLGVIPEMGS